MRIEELKEIFDGGFFGYYASPSSLEFLHNLLTSDVIRVASYQKPSGPIFTDGLDYIFKNCSKHVSESEEGQCAAILLHIRKLSLNGKYSIAGEVWYYPGRADLALYRPRGRNIIVVEVGETKIRKVYLCFFEPSLEELWHFPYHNGNYYIWTRGENWQPWAKEYSQYCLNQWRCFPPPLYTDCQY